MARTSAASPIAAIRDLFTAAERRILDTSFGKSLASATHAQLEEASRQARGFRDKWRDLSARQGRATKRVAGAAKDANARSHEKAGAFHDAILRIETRISELVSAAGEALGAKRRNPRAKAKDKKIAGRAARRTAPRPQKPVATRALPKPPAAKPVVAAVPAKPVAATAGPKASAKPAAPAKPAARSRKARIDRATTASVKSARGGRLDVSGQKGAKSAANAGRIAISGAKNRATHLAAAGKRQQARRDGRKR